MPTVRIAYPKARKKHTCDVCQGEIKRGDVYRRWVGTSEMWYGLATEKRCVGCFLTLLLVRSGS